MVNGAYSVHRYMDGKNAFLLLEMALDREACKSFTSQTNNYYEYIKLIKLINNNKRYFRSLSTDL